MSDGRRPRPPALARRLLECVAPRAMREALVGDLEEAFYADVLPARGAMRARAWYWRETIRVAVMRLPFVEGEDDVVSTGDSSMQLLAADLRFAVRMLARRPGFSLLAILTLAVGIGATTAIFSVLDPMLFRALPYPDAGRILTVWERDHDGSESNVGFATFTDIARDNKSLVAVAAIGSWQTVMTSTAEPERLEGERVSYGYFDVLGVQPVLGRAFRADEDAPNAPRVVVLSDGLWRRRFGGDPSLVGKPVTLGGNPYTVIGVMAKSFENVLGPRTQMWTPLRYDASLAWACRTCRHLRAVGRLKPAVDAASARRELDQLSANLIRAYPNDYPASGFALVPVRDWMTRAVRPALLAVFGAVALLLVIACANVTSLLLARAAQRESEFAVRIALGAGHRRVLRQLLTESVLLAAVGGAAGFALAYAGLVLLVRLGPADLPRLDAITVDARVLAFAIVVTALAGIASGLAPALHVARGDLQSSIRRAGHRTGGSTRTRSMLVVGEMALALVLLVGTGLLLRSLGRLLGVNPGVDPNHLLTMEVQVSGAKYRNDTAVRAFFDDALRAVRAIPGVDRAGLASQLPLGGNFDSYGVHIELKPNANPELDPSAMRYAVSADYLETMRIPVKRGRSLTAQDAAGAPEVLVINETFARHMWPGDDPIGKRVRVGAPDKGAWFTIVGIAGDVQHVSLDAARADQMYIPEAQWRFADDALTLVVRTRGDPAEMASAVRSAVWSVDKDQAITSVATMEKVLAASTARRRFLLMLFELFAVVALALAAAGTYGVLSGSVAQRAREIGIRAALGATRGDILRLVVRQGVGLAVAGIAIGTAAALALSRAIAGLLFGVTATDPLTFAAVATILLAVALAACAVPAWRAARLDPVVALRSET
ncbi:MAG: ADOP family duplicated permease [Gemmatimonadaceae bacterium]